MHKANYICLCVHIYLLYCIHTHTHTILFSHSKNGILSFRTIWTEVKDIMLRLKKKGIGNQVHPLSHSYGKFKIDLLEVEKRVAELILGVGKVRCG